MRYLHIRDDDDDDAALLLACEVPKPIGKSHTGSRRGARHTASGIITRYFFPSDFKSPPVLCINYIYTKMAPELCIYIGWW